MRISDWSSDVCSSDLPGEYRVMSKGHLRVLTGSLAVARKPNMKKSAGIAIAALALAGCAHSPFFVPEVSGNETHVRVENVKDSAEALRMAEEHCAKYGRVPRASGGGGYMYVYDCERPS